MLRWCLTSVVTIYALCHPRTGEIRYIGATRRRLRQRLKSHMSAARRGDADACCQWKRTLREWPEIRPYLTVPDHLGPSAERQVIAVLRANGVRLLNESDGGPGVPGYKHSQVARAKLSAASLGRKNSAEHVAKTAAANRGRRQSRESIEKRASQLRGRKRPPFSAEWRRRMSESAKRRPHPKHSPETIEKIRAAALARSPRN